MNQPLAYHIDEAAKLSGIGRSKLYVAIKEGRLIAHKAGNRTLVRAEALRAFLDALPQVTSAS